MIEWAIPAAIQGGKLLWDMFKPKPKSPGEQAAPWLEKAAGLYDPYMKQGQAAYGKYEPIYSNMAQDPAAYLSQLMSGYEESPYYSNMRDEALKAASATAAAGGRRGTPQDMAQQAKLSAALSGEGMQNWLSNVMGLQKTGLGGLENFYNKGFEATGDLANIYGSQANLALLNQMFKNLGSQQQAGDIFSGLSKLGGTLKDVDWSKMYKPSTVTSNFMPSPGRYTLGANIPNSLGG